MKHALLRRSKQEKTNQQTNKTVKVTLRKQNQQIKNLQEGTFQRTNKIQWIFNSKRKDCSVEPTSSHFGQLTGYILQFYKCVLVDRVYKKKMY